MVLAHAFGMRYDLPVPLIIFVLGGAAVVFASFLLVLPRTVTDGAAPVGYVPGPRAPGRVGRAVAPAVLAALVLAGAFGTDVVSENLLPTAFWLVVWVIVPLSCGLAGDWTRVGNPYAVLARAVDRPALRSSLIGGPPLAWPRWLGWWPAAVLFFVIACGELVFNVVSTQPHVTAVGLVVYAVVTAVGALVFGAERWLQRGEVFSVLFATWGRLGWWRFGSPGRRGLLGGLDGTTFEPSASRVTFTLLLLVSVSFDGLLSTPAWRDTRLRLSVSLAPGTTAYQLGEVVAFALLAVMAWVFFGTFAVAVHRAGRIVGGPATALAGLLPSLLPIAFGYLLAHNVQYVAVNAQLLFPLLGNPVGRSWWPHLPYPFNDGYELRVNLVSSAVAWYFEVVVLVAVHVVAVIVAHRHLHRVSAEGRARMAEWPWIAAMVCYTMTSLWLLAQPLVEGG